MTGNDLTEVKLKIGSERDRTREAQTPDGVCGSCDALWLQKRTNESPPSLHSDPLMLEDLRRFLIFSLEVKHLSASVLCVPADLGEPGEDVQ